MSSVYGLSHFILSRTTCHEDYYYLSFAVERTSSGEGGTSYPRQMIKRRVKIWTPKCVRLQSSRFTHLAPYSFRILHPGNNDVDASVSFKIVFTLVVSFPFALRTHTVSEFPQQEAKRLSEDDPIYILHKCIARCHTSSVCPGEPLQVSDNRVYRL